jgi:hypothetical protein
VSDGGSVTELLRHLARAGLRRGVLRGSRGWLTTGLGAGAYVLARRYLSEQPHVVFRTELEPGERLEITARPPER